MRNIFLLFLVFIAGCASNEVFVKKIEFNLHELKLDSASSTVIISSGVSCANSSEVEFAEKINQWGYNAVIIDHCTNRGIRSNNRNSSLAPWDISSDFFNAAKEISRKPWHNGKIIVIGRGSGGAGVLDAINLKSQINLGRFKEEEINLIDAYVAFYPPCQVMTMPDFANKPILIHHGLNDSVSSVAGCPYSRLNAKSNYEISLYPGVGHAFDVDASDLVVSNPYSGIIKLREFNENAKEISLLKTEDFIRKHAK